MLAELVGPVPVPATPSPKDAPSSEGGPGCLKPAGSLYTGVTLRYPGSQAGPTSTNMPVSGQKLCPHLSWPRKVSIQQSPPTVACPAPSASALQPPPPPPSLPESLPKSLHRSIMSASRRSRPQRRLRQKVLH